jgi:hypothetical protein
VTHGFVNLVEAKLLSMNPSGAVGCWKVQRANLDVEPVRGIVQHLHETGKVVLKGIVSQNQSVLFRKTNNLTKRGIMSASSNSAFHRVVVAAARCPM